MLENKETFQARIQPYLPPSQQLDVKLAYCLAKFGHRAQVRKELIEGQPTRYFEHVRRVSIMLMDQMQIHDRDMIIAALLHDSLEDTRDLSAELIEHCFGPNVAGMVRLLSKLPKEGYYDRLRNCKNWKVLALKMCDRLDNLRSLMVPGVTPEFQKRQIKETKEIYIPLFSEVSLLCPSEHLIGVFSVKDEIRDLVVRYDTIIEITEQKKKNFCVICQGQGWYPSPDDENMVECCCQQPV